MALKLSSASDTIKVVPRIDDAIGPEAKYDKYLEDLNETHLDLGERVPTRIVMRKVLPYGLATKVENSQMSIKGAKGDGEGMDIQLNAAFMMEDVRCSICGVDNPPGMSPDQMIKFELASDGGASEEFVAQLHAAKLVGDLYKARKNIAGGVATKQKK